MDEYLNGLFSSRKTLNEALEFAYQIAAATDHKMAVLAAVHVVLNTAIQVAKEEPCNKA